MALPKISEIGFALRHSAQLKIYNNFLTPDYQRHNLARLRHLASLGLAIDGKRVLEVGAGIGDHTLFYLYRCCEVLPTDGRAENVDFIRNRLGIRAEVLDVQSHPEAILALGHFDILHCYGFLYHISNPEDFLQHAARIAQSIFLETCVSYGSAAEVNPVAEQSSNPSQALHGRGCRPTRAWVFQTLKKHYEFVYCPKTQPRHEEFPLDWDKAPASNDRLTRAVFIASHAEIGNPLLVQELPLQYTV